MPYYRRNLIVLCIAILLAGISWNQVIPFLPLFMKDLGVKSHFNLWVGGVYAAQSLAAMIAMPFWGKMGDQRGRKRMIIRAGICLAGIYFGMSVCRTVEQLAVLRFLNGALTGFVPGSFALIATNTPQGQAPRAVAWAQTFSYAGLIIGPGLGGLLAGIWGYRGSMLLSGVVVLLSTLLVLWLVQEPNKASAVEKTSLIEDFVISLKSPVQLSLLFALAMFLAFGGAINPYLALHLERLSGVLPHWPPKQFWFGAVFSLPAISFVISAQMWTRLGERHGYHKMIVVGFVGGAVGALCLAFISNIWLFAAFYFLTGIWLAAISPSVGAITCTRVEESFRGRAYGIQQSAGTFGGLIVPFFVALTLIPLGIHYVFAFVGVLFLFSSFAFSRLTCRWPREVCEASSESDPSAQAPIITSSSKH